MRAHGGLQGHGLNMPPISPVPLLDVRHLSVTLHPMKGAAFDAVHDVSFTLGPGETFCLVGESGCGKSLTALAILGLVPEIGSVSGEVWFEGKNLVSLSGKAMQQIRGQRIGMVFQEPMTSLNPVLRVGDQVAEVLEFHLHLRRKEALEHTVELFRQVGIPSPELRIREYPHQLSGGMRQRIMIAMALACKPRLILADEPTTALDVTIQGQILSLLREMGSRQGTGTLLITHDLGVVSEMADNVGVMYAGCMVERGAVTTLLEKPLHPYTEGLIRSAPSLEHFNQKRLHTIAGNVPSPGQRPAGCLFRPRCPHAFERCMESPPCVSVDGRQVCCWLYCQA